MPGCDTHWQWNMFLMGGKEEMNFLTWTILGLSISVRISRMIRIYCILFQVLGGEKPWSKNHIWELSWENRKGTWLVPGRVVLPSIFVATPILVIPMSSSCCHHPSKTTTAILLKEIRLWSEVKLSKHTARYPCQSNRLASTWTSFPQRQHPAPHLFWYILASFHPRMM